MKKPRAKTNRAAAIKDRAAKTAAVITPASPIAAEAVKEKKKSFNPFIFFQEVRAEARKITWTSRRETWITSVMVFIMVVLAAIFFFGTDTVLSFLVSRLLQFATAG